MNTMMYETTEAITGKSIHTSCARCHGHMVHDVWTDHPSDSGPSDFGAFRCIQCGDVIDEVILRHRSNPAAVYAVTG